MIFPRPRVEKYGDLTKLDSKRLTVSLPAEDKDAIRALSLFLPGVDITEAEGDAVIAAVRTDAYLPEEYYLKVSSGLVTVRYSEYRGLVYAMASLSELFYNDGGDLYLCSAEISDKPAVYHRGVMLDVARGVMPKERFISDIIFIAKAKMNVLHLHLADSKGVAVELDSLPESYRLRGYYTKSDVCEILEICRVLGLEVIPEFDMPAHSSRLLLEYPSLRCDVPSLAYQSLWTSCPGSEDTYALYSRIIDEMCEMFPRAKYFHIGGDEIEFLDLAEKEARPRICHWDECKACRALMNREGLSDRSELHYYFINRINRMVKKNNKRTVMWSDQIDCKKPKGIDGDVLMQFWRIAGRGRGPHDGCSMQLQLDYGYEMINSYYPETYVDIEEYMTPEKLSTWRWDERPTVSDDRKTQIIGAETCAWEYGNLEEYPHYAASLPSSVLLMADKLWGGLIRQWDRDDAIRMTRAVLGISTPCGFEVFSAIGSIMPPRCDALSYPDKVSLSEEEIFSTLKTLYTIRGEAVSEVVLEAYIKAVENTKNNIKK